MVSEGDESAIVVVVPEAEPLVSSFREQFDPAAMRGMPAHITLLAPFREPEAITPELRTSLRQLFGRHRAFAFTLTGLCGFRGVAYLRPEPLDPFDALVRDLVIAFPEHPPYGGAFPEPMPHLTVAQQPPAISLEATSEAIVTSIGARTPLGCHAAEATLAIKQAGRWRLESRFAFIATRSSP